MSRSVFIFLVCFACITTLSQASARLKSNKRQQLDLCDCQPASGEPGNLSCDKEGFIITSFERIGQWVAGGGSVPLSRAICCRPCLPSAEDLGIDDDDADGQPLAVVSMGCHASTDPLGVRCEATSNSFVTGFTEAVSVFSTADANYPINTAECCTPAILMSNGDAWELERCGCAPSEDPDLPVGCGGNGDVQQLHPQNAPSQHRFNGTGLLLTGFDFFRVSPIGQVVPVGPAKCCGLCLSDTRHPADDCSDLNHCSGKGVCLLGRCECLDGWGSPDCSQSLSGRSRGSIPPWAVALIVIGSCILALILLSAAAHIAEIIFESHEGNDGGEEEDDSRRPLLLRIDPDDVGSVGSRDTDDDRDESGLLEEAAVVEQRIQNVIHQLEGDAGGHSLQGDGEGQAPPGALLGVHDNRDTDTNHNDDNNNDTRNINGIRTIQSTTASSARTARDEQVQEGADDEASVNEKTSPHVATRYPGVGPLNSVDCVVCMIAPVQTVLIPCGHVCMCRKCCRRLNRCPICRKEVVRRQRLYV